MDRVIKKDSLKNPLDFKYNILCITLAEWQSLSEQLVDEQDLGSNRRKLSAVIFAFASEQAEAIVKNHIISQRRAANQIQLEPQGRQQRKIDANVLADSASNPEIRDMLISAVAPLQTMMQDTLHRMKRLESNQAPGFRKAPSNPPHLHNPSSNVSKNVAGPAGAPFNSSARNKGKRTQRDMRMTREVEDWIQDDEPAEELYEDLPNRNQGTDLEHKKQRPNPLSQNSGQARPVNTGHPQQNRVSNEKFLSRGHGQMFHGHPHSLPKAQDRQQQSLRGRGRGLQQQSLRGRGRGLQQPLAVRGRGQHRSQIDHGQQVPQQAWNDQQSYQDQDPPQIPRMGLWSRSFRQTQWHSQGRGRGRSQE